MVLGQRCPDDAVARAVDEQLDLPLGRDHQRARTRGRHRVAPHAAGPGCDPARRDLGARVFVDNADLRPYFYDGKPVPTLDGERNRVLAVAEMYVNLMDNVVTQGPVLKRPEIAHDWETYVLDVYRASPAARELWLERGSTWYAHSPLVPLFAVQSVEA
jgi:hypothetical protein